MSGLLRVSVGALCRIEANNLLLLGVNKNRIRAGREVLTPLGGAMEITTGAARDALAALGVIWETPGSWTSAGHLDLRLVLPEDRLPQFETWLDRFDEGELNALRELREELVNEYRALGGETFDRLIGRESVRWRRRAISTEVTGRTGVGPVPTRRYGLVYDIQCPAELELGLSLVCGFPGLLEWVTQDEISAGRSASGREIGVNARDVLA